LARAAPPGKGETIEAPANPRDAASGRPGHAKLHRGKRSRRIRYVICLFRILVSKDVPAICLECAISSFFHDERKPLSGTILRW